MKCAAGGGLARSDRPCEYRTVSCHEVAAKRSGGVVRSLGTGMHRMSDLQLHEGAGSFVFPDNAAGPRRSMRIFYYRPQSCVRDARVVIAMHGLDRAAAHFRDVLAGQAERNGQIVLVPEFDMGAFPDVYAYNYGNVKLAPPSLTVMPRSLWISASSIGCSKVCASPSPPIVTPSLGLEILLALSSCCAV